MKCQIFQVISSAKHIKFLITKMICIWGLFDQSCNSRVTYVALFLHLSNKMEKELHVMDGMMPILKKQNFFSNIFSMFLKKCFEV